MQGMKQRAIAQWLNQLIGLPICLIGRASNMLWIGIGEKFKVVNRKGREVEKSTYALHVQCPWRIINNKKKILLASSDIYSPRSNLDFQNDFDWEPIGNNLFDEKSQRWIQEQGQTYVTEYRLDQQGDLTLIFSSGERLQIFIAASDDTECWRLFKPKGGKAHLVASGLGIKFE